MAVQDPAGNQASGNCQTEDRVDLEIEVTGRLLQMLMQRAEREKNTADIANLTLWQDMHARRVEARFVQKKLQEK